MLLGKRPRPPMKRTTSMTEFTLDLTNVVGEATPHPQPSDQHKGGPLRPSDALDQRSLAAAVSPRNYRRNSADLAGTAHFLKSCSLCKRRLIPGRDIYMYRGDSAFCSLECRQKQIIQDEGKEKCSWASKKEGASTATGSEVSANGEITTTITAV